MRTVFLGLLLMVGFAACTTNNVKDEPGLKKIFDESQVHGSFALFNNGNGDFVIYNLARYRDSAYQPAHTFNIVSSLVGLHTGKIVNEKMVIPASEMQITMVSGDTLKTLTMEAAFKAASIPYFQTIARKIGKDTMQAWLDSLSYGKKKITTAVDSFWLDNSLKITPDEQLGLVKKLYFEQLPFSKTVQTMVKKVMMQEQNTNYALAYTIGWNKIENNKTLGWVTGWIEENKHPYFFVLNFEDNTATQMPTVGIQLLKNILKQQGFFQGKR